MMSAAFSALASHWRTRPLQLATLITGLALATGLWTGVQAINSEARSSYDRAAAVLGQDTLARLRPKSGGPVGADRFVALRRAGWLVSPVVEGTVRLGQNRVRVRGIDLYTLPRMAAPVGLAGNGDFTAFLAGDALLLAHPETMAGLAGTDLNLRSSLRVAPGELLGDIATAWELLERRDFDYLILAPGQSTGLAQLSEIAPDLEEVKPDPQGDIARLTNSFHLNLTAFGFLSFAVGLFIVHATIGLAFEQRRPMIRTLRALGIPKRTRHPAAAHRNTGAGAGCRSFRRGARLFHRSAAAAGRRRDAGGSLRRRCARIARPSGGLDPDRSCHCLRGRPHRRRSGPVAHGSHAAARSGRSRAPGRWPACKAAAGACWPQCFCC